ncbi:hypothetical protein [Paenibacillus donghaensis]|uniref:Uncharacterized protein n=1 Tax=Paenibacillus donghaensis TaxID=414771 RepID=A0A2Z2KPJ0_9BACL|nr:hypothetical protein [Paenibacillus donghaensis]ASA25623.1 hypothetical protein B9T62_35760 [Paenibacillus donghaensis]
MSKSISKNVSLDDLKTLEESSEKEGSFEKIYTIILYRGKHPNFQYEIYVVEFLSNMPGGYKYRFLLHELDRKTNLTMYNKAQFDMKISSHLATGMLDNMIKKATQMKLKRDYTQVENLVPYLTDTCSLAEAEEYHQIFEEFVAERLEVAPPPHSKMNYKNKEDRFVILDKPGSISKYGTVTVATTKSQLMDLFFESHEMDSEPAKHHLDGRLLTIIKMWVTAGISVSKTKGRNQDTVSYKDIDGTSESKMYILNCPKVTEVMKKNGAN